MELAFSDSSSINLGCIVGKDGKDGINGTDGKDGANGADGKDGEDGKDGANGVDGKDGIGIANVTITDDGVLNVELTNGTTLNLGSIKGKDGIGISKSEINADGEFVLTYTNGQSTNLGKVVGADGINGTNGADGKDGINGADGKDGTGIVNVTISAEGALSVELSNGTVLNLGNIKGADGIGISKSEINSNGELLLTYTSGETANLGVVVGAKGADGKDGIGIKTVTLSADGELSILLTDNTVLNLGNVKGEKGDTGEKGEKGDKGADGKDGVDGKDGRGIAKTELVNGELIITYTDGTSDNLGSIGGGVPEEDEEILKFTLLADDTYSVSAGNGAKKVDSIEIPSIYNGKAVTQIANKGFMELSTLKSITMPDSITNIGEYAFYNCISISNITLPNNLQSIQKYAFSKCTSLLEITIPNATTYIGEYAFYDSSLTSATFKNTDSWVTSKYPDKVRKDQILLFEYTNYDWYQNDYTDYEYASFSQPKIIAELLSGDYSASYYVYRDLKYRTVSMYKYAWSRS